MRNILAGILLLTLASCKGEQSSDQLTDKKVEITRSYLGDSIKKNEIVKIVKTKAFKGEKKFNQIVPIEPAYRWTIDQEIGMDFSWTIKYYDKYNNILYQEDIRQNDSGEEVITRKIFNNYFSPKEGLLTSVNEEFTPFNGSSQNREDYLRDSKGLLTEKNNYTNQKLTSKSLYTYNEFSQRVKTEVFLEDGLYKKSLFMYDKQSPSAKHTKTIEEFFHETGYRKEFYYERDEDNQITKSRVLQFEKDLFGKDKLSYFETTIYHEYINGKATKIEISKDYKPEIAKVTTPQIKSDPLEPIEGKYNAVTINININLNEKGDVVEYNYGYGTNIIFDYTYNDNNELTKLILTYKGGDNYIITREIRYLLK